MILANTYAYGQPSCDVVDECAKAALQAAQTALDEAKSLRQQLQALIDNSAKPPRIPKETVSAERTVQDVSCANGEYLVGVRYSWSGTCQRQCAGDGPILRSVAPICRKLQN